MAKKNADYRASKAFIDLVQKWLLLSKVAWGILYQHKRIKVYVTLSSCFCNGSNLQYVYHREHLNFIQFERLPFFLSYLWENKV